MSSIGKTDPAQEPTTIQIDWENYSSPSFSFFNPDFGGKTPIRSDEWADQYSGFGGNLIGLNARAPYGFGVNMRLLAVYATEHETQVTDPDFLDRNKSVKDSRVIRYYDRNDHYLPISLEWHTPSVGIRTRRNEFLGLSAYVGIGGNLERHVESDRIAERWSTPYSYSETYEVKCYDSNGNEDPSKTCSDTVTHSGYNSHSRTISGDTEASTRLGWQWESGIEGCYNDGGNLICVGASYLSFPHADAPSENYVLGTARLGAQF